MTFNKTAELEIMNQDYVQNQISGKSNSFLKIFLNNFSASLYIFILPMILFSVISICGKISPNFSESFLKVGLLFSKVFILSYYMYNYIALTFSKLFFIFILPLPVFFITYAHGLVEIPAMILSFTFSLILVDDVHDFFYQPHISDAKNQISTLIKNFLMYVIILFFILVIAAFFETQITPHLIQSSFENYFRTL